jgi:hypothetical protein
MTFAVKVAAKPQPERKLFYSFLWGDEQRWMA